MKFQKPSKIQERALPLLLQNPCVCSSILDNFTSHIIKQAPEHDRAIAIWNRKDSCVRPDDVEPDRFRQADDSSAQQFLAILARYNAHDQC